jgi:O-acetylhomoserine (thiol)-lyase
VDRKFGIETLCLHAGHIPDEATGSRAVPIYQTSSYVFDDTEHAASLFNLQSFGNIYTRLSNPTTAVFEERMAALEAGRASVAVSSGMAASAIALMTLCEMGDHIVAVRTLYGGTHSLFDFNFKRMGIEVSLVDPDDFEAMKKAIRPNTKVIYGESIGNPVINVLDIEKIAKVAHDADLPLMLDNTFPTPYLCKPFEWGADIVIHSATKFLGGHGTTIGGVIIESGEFPWDNGKFPGMTEPSEGYHGVRFLETFGDFAFTMRARLEQLRVLGPSLSPFNSFQLLQGVETLPVRMDRHCSNALAVAEFLLEHPLVDWVNYPGLSSNRYYSLQQKYMPKGAGGIMSFGLLGGVNSGAKFIENVQFLSHLANVGDAKTLVIHPASTTHRQMTEAQQVASGVTADMIRISVGLETLDDILWDLDQALQSSQE